MATTPTESTKILTEEEDALRGLGNDYDERYGFHDPENYVFKAPKGLTRELVQKISEMKNEPGWMTDFRLKAYDHFISRPMPNWAPPGCPRRTRLLRRTERWVDRGRSSANGPRCRPAPTGPSYRRCGFAFPIITF